MLFYTILKQSSPIYTFFDILYTIVKYVFMTQKPKKSQNFYI